MDRRFFLFVFLAMTIFMGWMAILQRLQPPPPPGGPADVADAAADGDVGEAPAGPDAGEIDAGRVNDPSAADASTTAPAERDIPAAAPAEAAEATAAKFPLLRPTLGSLDPGSRQRMLVTFNTRGAAVEMIELTDRRYLDVVDRSGYLGYLALADVEEGDGCRVNAVGHGTPAAAAGLQVGDVILTLDEQDVVDVDDFHTRLRKRRPKQRVTLGVVRDGGPQELTVDLIRRPVSIVRPEYLTKALDTTAGATHDPLSFLLTLDSVGDRDFDRLLNDGVDLRTVNWELTTEDAEAGLVEFRYAVPQTQLVAIKRYRLEPGESDVGEDPLARAYHLTLELEIENRGSQPQTVAYRLDGPTGLPTSGWWYANKIQREWFSAGGLRDFARQLSEGTFTLAGSAAIADADAEEYVQRQMPVDFLGIDALYFAAMLIPEKDAETNWIAESRPVTVGSLPTKDPPPARLTNVTCRLISQTEKLEPQKSLQHTYTVFAGPKQSKLLRQYGPPGRVEQRNLSSLIYYGLTLFMYVAIPLGWVLEMFAHLNLGYGVAIVCLTIVVRLGMFPISRKQALGAIKMQELAPEMKRISEKYKNDLEKRSKALQEMYRKHNYSPLSGCLPLFIQMPIFIGLYKSLQTNINLRGAPLISDSIRWADNLSAPDMLLRWDSWMFFSDYTGFLGPYLNILPLVTVALFLWQQKLFTPPPTDEQSAMMQKMMKYMMFFMGVLFFKVPSGLCVYFIASSFWGIGERKMLPKPPPKDAQTAVAEKPQREPPAKEKPTASKSESAKPTTNGQGGKRKKGAKKKGKR
ncbi:MAG: membrane protein insertase YidC [Planctomycetota bacterium]|nr:MAG: membrane protein insertase YidC [Planctomycetota bacterium]